MTQTGVSSTDGVPLTLPLGLVAWLCSSAIAAFAAAAASSLIGFYTVPVCQPAMMYWMPVGVAS